MAAATLSRRRAAALLGLLAWWLLAAPTDAEVATTCAEDEECPGAPPLAGAKMLQKKVEAAQLQVSSPDGLPAATGAAKATLSDLQEDGTDDEEATREKGEYWPWRTTPPPPTTKPPPMDFCGHSVEQINKVIAPPKEVQQVMSIMLGVSWGVGYKNMSKPCKSLPLKPDSTYITFTVGTGILQNAEAERRKLEIQEEESGEVATTQERFAAAAATFSTSASFCIALRMCSHDPDRVDSTWLKTWTFGFYHKGGMLLYKHGPVELKLHGLAFSTGGELYVKSLASPLWGYGEGSQKDAPVTHLHWWLKLSTAFAVDPLKAIDISLSGTLGAYVEMDGEADIAAFLANMVSEQDGTVENLKASIPQSYLVKMVGTARAALKFDLKKLFGPAAADSDTDEGQEDAPCHLFKLSLDASLLREARIDLGSEDNTYIAQYFSARARLDLAELLTVSDFFQELLQDWAMTASAEVYMAFYFKTRLSLRTDAGFRIGGKLSLNCAFLRAIPKDLAGAFPKVKKILDNFCKNKIDVKLDLVARSNQLDWGKSCLHINDESFCLDDLPTCPHPANVGDKCAKNADCTGDEYGPLKRGYCKGDNGFTGAAFCAGRCEKLAPPGHSCAASSTNTLNVAHLAEHQKCEAYFQGVHDACRCGKCTDTAGKLGDGSWCANNGDCESDFCDKGSIIDTTLKQGCTGKCTPKQDIGAACHFDGACKSGFCSNNCHDILNCNTGGTCVVCHWDHHCGSNQYCEGYQCKNKLNDGQRTDKHWRCKSNKDVCGKCAYSSLGGKVHAGSRCSENSDCGTGRCGRYWWQSCWGCGCHCENR